MDAFDIVEMVNLIARPLQTRGLCLCDTLQQSQKKGIDNDDSTHLVCIRGEDGSAKYPKKDRGSKTKAEGMLCGPQVQGQDIEYPGDVPPLRHVTLDVLMRVWVST